MTEISVTGQDAIQFLNFLEDQKEEGLFHDVTHKEIEIPNDGHESDAGISIILTGLVTILGALITNYLTRQKNNEITFDLVKEDGRKLSVTLKNMTLEEVKQSMREFLD